MGISEILIGIGILFQLWLFWKVFRQKKGGGCKWLKI